jgi:hypothetical protein
MDRKFVFQDGYICHYKLKLLEVVSEAVGDHIENQEV